MALKYWLVVGVLGIGWGMSFLFNAILLRELGPMTVSFGRVSLGALGCWIYVGLSGRAVPWRGAPHGFSHGSRAGSRRGPRRGPRRGLVLGVLGMLGFGAISFAAPFAIYALGQQHIASGVAGIINALTPVMVVIVSHFWPGGERATPAKSAGVLCGFAGIVILALPVLQRGGGSALWGIILTIAAPVCYGISVNLARRYKALDPAVLAAMALSGASVMIAPLALWHDGWPVIVRVETWASLGMIGFVLTSASFIVFYRILPLIGATNLSTVTFIAPVSAVGLGVWVLHEPLLREHVLGMATIFCGLLLIDGRILSRLPDRMRLRRHK